MTFKLNCEQIILLLATILSSVSKFNYTGIQAAIDDVKITRSLLFTI